MASSSRARELLPNILLTVLSVVQALALEALWSAIHDSPEMFAAGHQAWVLWLQAAAIFQGIIVIWLFYISIVMRFSWVPTTRDLVAPFLLGAGELSMIQTMDPDLLSWWFWLLAALFAFSARVSNQMFVSGLADPENARVEVAPAAGLAERWASFIAAGVIAACGGAVWFAGAEGFVAIVGLVLANGLLFGQGMLIQHYWREWMGGLPPS